MLIRNSCNVHVRIYQPDVPFNKRQRNECFFCAIMDRETISEYLEAEGLPYAKAALISWRVAISRRGRTGAIKRKMPLSDTVRLLFPGRYH